jgi:hypothetical protein
MKAMRTVSRVLTAALLAAAATSCSSAVRSGQSPVMLVVDSLLGIRGSATTGTPSSILASDVITIVTTGGTCTTTNPCPTVFNDSGQATMHLVLKDIGLPGATPSPSSNNTVTVTRVRVTYRRTDGRNQEGVDVPYGFDAAVTASIAGSGGTTVGFPLVRIQAKQEAPLMALRTNGQILSMIADVTFYGTDLVGNNITATGSINIDFGNFGDQ